MTDSVAISGEFRVGSVLGDSFRILGRNLVPFVALAMLLLSPAFLVLMVGTQMGLLESSRVYMLVLVFSALLSLVLFVVARGAVVYGTFRYFQGRSVTFSDNVANGLRNAWRVISVGFVSALLISLGYSFFIIPGFYLSTIYWAAVPVAVVEDCGVGDSLRRSSSLAEGHRWKIFGLVLLWGVLQYLMEDIPSGIIEVSGFELASIVVAWLGISLSTALGGVMSTVSYYRLRQIKEGINIDQIAAVFD